MRGATRHHARRFFRHAPQHRVHESRGARAGHLAGERDSRRDRGVRRNAIERGQLIGAEPEDVADPRRDPFPAIADIGSDRGVEYAGGAEGSSREFMGETTVGVGQSRERNIEREIERPAAVHQFQQPPGGAARCQPLGQVSIPAIGVDGTATSRRGIRPARYARRPASTA